MSLDVFETTLQRTNMWLNEVEGSQGRDRIPSHG